MNARDDIDAFIKQSGKFLSTIPHIRALGVELVTMAPNTVLLRLPYNKKLTGNPDTGVIAGGAISAVLDNACGYAVTATTGRQRSFATLDLRIDYMKPATPGEDVLAFAECYKLTRRIAFVRGYAYHTDKDDPIANVTATFMFTQRPSADTESGAADGT